MGVTHQCFCLHSKTDHLTGHVKKQDGTYTSGPHSGPCQWYDCECQKYEFKQFVIFHAPPLSLEPIIIRTDYHKKARRKNSFNFLRIQDLDSNGKPKAMDIAEYTCPKCGSIIKASHRGAHMKNHKKHEELQKIHAS